jgi:hypothetical protein
MIEMQLIGKVLIFKDMSNNKFKVGGDWIMVVGGNDVDFFIYRKLVELSNTTKRVHHFPSLNGALAQLKVQLLNNQLPAFIIFDADPPFEINIDFIQEYFELVRGRNQFPKVLLLSNSKEFTSTFQSVDNQEIVLGFFDKPLSLEKMSEILPFHQ